MNWHIIGYAVLSLITFVVLLKFTVVFTVLTVCRMAKNHAPKIALFLCLILALSQKCENVFVQKEDTND